MKGKMMLFAIHAVDALDSPRTQHYDDHKSHLKRTGRYGVTLVLDGLLLGEDGISVVGSLMIFKASDLASVRRYNDDDPFRKKGVWSIVHISQFDRRT